MNPYFIFFNNKALFIFILLFGYDRSSLPFMPECRLLIVLASHCRAPALGKGASVAAAHLVSKLVPHCA